MKKYILLLVCSFSLVSNAQEISSYYNNVLITEIGYSCMKTSVTDSCSQNELYTTINITKKNILISKKTVSTSGEEIYKEIGRYTYTKIKNQIIIDYPDGADLYAKIISLEFKPNEIIGKIEYPSGSISEKTFEEHKELLIAKRA